MELNTKAAELEAGLAALEEGKQALQEGWKTYYTGAQEARKELSDGAEVLADADKQLKEAKHTLDTMAAPETFILDRNTNIGYVAVNNNSDIVAGVSRVFPVFFLLVAALVCITTMTRIVEEERTQIGTLKALGYSNIRIAGKYLFYAGSAAILGCGLGVFVGSVVFPMILWQGYGIILTLGKQIDIVFDIPLCLIVVGVYALVMLLVTWSCCRLALREVPAELIRPKAPTSGKKILLEYLSFWEKLSFLNKVTLRNIFRYRQRLIMMLIGIGGCTALLITGFGIGDSIVDIVSYQFERVTPYDMQVQFSSGLDEEQRTQFRKDLSGQILSVGFAHQSSVELDYDGTAKNVYMIAPKDPIDDYFDLHNGDRSVQFPGEGEAILSVGIAEAMGIRSGDEVVLRDSDMNMLSLKVADIFDNNVYNYIIVSPETVISQIGQEPEYQIAYVNVPDGLDPHSVGAKISNREDVLILSVSEDLANSVGSMLDAMNSIVLTVIVCAGLLAVIVLYNLTNINITERLREIATIKVLGFYEGESAAYVFKENLILSVMGACLGILGGKFLLDFVMSQIRLDMVWLPPRIQPISLLLSVAITLLMAVLVDFILYFRLEKINMAEALKSVE